MANEGEAARCELTRPVYLIGFMGSGKTSVMRHLARTCGLAAVDADLWLEQRAGRTIAEVFATCGEGWFRELESDCLRELSRQAPQLVSCGGGVVKRPENVQTMRDTGFIVCLDVTAEAAAARIPDASSRPLFRDLETARATIAERAPLYRAAADAVVDTTGRTVPEVAAEVRALLADAGVLRG